jgi:hypothetical protein
MEHPKGLTNQINYLKVLEQDSIQKDLPQPEKVNQTMAERPTMRSHLNQMYALIIHDYYYFVLR